MSTEPLIFLCAGGTGGHVFPARALAEELTRRGFKTAFITDKRGAKYLDNVPDEMIYLISLNSPGYGFLNGIIFRISLISAYFQSRKFIKKQKPSAVIGFGGYPSAPPVYAAQKLGIPTILHEQNAILGKAHDMLAAKARAIAVSHKNTQGLKGAWQKRAVLTGNPVRSEIIVLRDFPYPMIGGDINILIFGGSLGAASFANVIPQAMIKVAKALRTKMINLRIVHQAREDDIERVQKVYNDAGLFVEVKSFFDDMPQRIDAAHLLICRSGASTIAEITCAGRPAVYVPYPWHKDQQQLHNANNVVKAGGGWILEERNLTPENMIDMLTDILPDKLHAAAEKARNLGEPEAVSKLADLVGQTIGINPTRIAITHQQSEVI